MILKVYIEIYFVANLIKWIHGIPLLQVNHAEIIQKYYIHTAICNSAPEFN